MTLRIFQNILIITLIIMLSAISILGIVGQTYFNQNIKKQLAKEADYLEAGITVQSNEFLKHLSNTSSHIIHVDFSGNILYDNMPEHSAPLDLTERDIAAAITEGYGSDIRYSETYSQNAAFYSRKLTDGTLIQLSLPTYSVSALLHATYQPILLLFFAALIIIGIFALLLSRSIVRPINQLDLDHPEPIAAYPELNPIIDKLIQQNRKVSAQLQELKIRQTEFNTITANMSEGMIIIDRKADILSCNKSATHILGVDPIPRSILSFPETTTLRDTVRQALSGKNGYASLRIADSYYSIFSTPVAHNDEIVGAVIVLLDETEKEAREKLRREFTANISHELKTPLTSISGFAELIKSGLTDDDTTRHFANRIYCETQRLIDLVGDIIRLSQLDDGEIPYDTLPQPLYEIAAATLERLEPIAKSHGISLSLSGEPVTISGNRQILEEMLYNLCDNAIKYNRENGSVKMYVSMQNGQPLFKISDTGIGIPADLQTRVFERFFRVDKSHSKEIGGTGLGLSIVKHGAAYHHAQIELQSTLHVGTTISLLFPAI